jgi:hypothetical protein
VQDVGPGRSTSGARLRLRLPRPRGSCPHEILLQIARGQPVTVYHGEVVDGKLKLTEQLIVPDFDAILDAAKAAAPFYAPKLQAIAAVAAETSNPIEELMQHVQSAATNRARPGQ